jgi:hypothetical protein
MFIQKRTVHAPGLLFAAVLVVGAVSPPIQPATAATRAASDLCSVNSPFGKVLRLGRESEIFVSSIDTSIATKAPSLLRLDVTTDTQQLTELELVGNTANNRDNIGSIGATIADLNGDGADEFVQAFSDSANQYQVLTHQNGQPLRHKNLNQPGHTLHAAAAGDVLARNDGTEQLVLASKNASGQLSVNIVAENATNGVGDVLASWSSALVTRTNATDMHVMVGNVDDDGFEDIVVVAIVTNGGVRNAHMIYLEHEPAYVSSGVTVASGLRERASRSYFLSRATESTMVRTAFARLSGAARDDLYLAYAVADVNQPTAGPITIKRFTLGLTDGTMQFMPREQLVIPSALRGFDMAAGDLNGDFKDELVLAYDDDGTNLNGVLVVTAVELVGADTPTPALAKVNNDWRDGQNGRRNSTRVDLDVGDIDKDNRAEIVVGFRDESPLGMQVALIKPSLNSAKQVIGFALHDAKRYDPTLNHPMSVHMGDYDKDSRLAVANATCRPVTERIIASTSFVPPFWKNIQGGQEHSGFIGDSRSQGGSNETSVSYNRSNSVSSFLGAEVGVSFFDLVEFSAAARATSEREYATSSGTTTNVATTTVKTVSRSWANSAVVYEQANYACYTYTIFDDGQALAGDQAALRMCEYVKPAAVQQVSAAVLDGWDSASGRNPEYTPVLRDWASLGLFRGTLAAQSSVSGTQVAANAVDSELAPNSGSYVSGPAARTQIEQSPWWQIDLGESQQIAKLRIWAPPASLSNVYVLISDVDFRTLPNQANPAALAAQPGVYSYTLASLGLGLSMTSTVGGSLTWQTLDAAFAPARGRYVRIQRTDNASLALSEVQIFGGNHVDPDRYPLDIRDSVADDGVFETLIFNPLAAPGQDGYAWVKVRGNVLWTVPKTADEPLRGLNATWGGASTSWVMSRQSETSRMRSKSVSTSTSIGAEVEVQGGAGLKLQAGTATQLTTGYENETVIGVSWGNAYETGGAVQGFPDSYSAPNLISWSQKCAYGFTPYSYEVSETANLGYTQRFPVLDYVVPYINSQVDNRKTDTIDYCRNGNPTSNTPQANDDNTSGYAGRSNRINPLANDQGNGLILASVGQGGNGETVVSDGPLLVQRRAAQAGAQGRTVLYTPNPGFTGTDTFTYTARNALGAEISGIVTVTVRYPPVAYFPIVSR